MTLDEMRAQLAADKVAMAFWRERHESFVAEANEARLRKEHVTTQTLGLLADAAACRVSGLRQCIARLEAVIEFAEG